MSHPGSDAWRWTHWGDPCGRSSKYTLGTGQIGTNFSMYINMQCLPVWQTLYDVMRQHNYRIVQNGGSYNCRQITGGSVYSPHAWGLGWDINPATNPYVPMPPTGPVTDMPLAMIQDIYRIQTRKSGLRCIKWGGDWDADGEYTDHTISGAMHFEVIVTPQQIAEGIVHNREAEPPLFTDTEINELKRIVASLESRGSNGTFAGFAVDHLRGHQPNSVTQLSARVATAEQRVTAVEDRLRAHETNHPSAPATNAIVSGDTVRIQKA